MIKMIRWRNIKAGNWIILESKRNSFWKRRFYILKTYKANSQLFLIFLFPSLLSLIPSLPPKISLNLYDFFFLLLFLLFSFPFPSLFPSLLFSLLFSFPFPSLLPSPFPFPFPSPFPALPLLLSLCSLLSFPFRFPLPFASVFREREKHKGVGGDRKSTRLNSSHSQ